MVVWFIIGSTVIGLGRFLVPGHNLSWPGTYEAFAHIWCGYLLAYAIHGGHRPWETESSSRWTAIMMLSIITILEAICFAMR
jgi:hypothetical protein